MANLSVGSVWLLCGSVSLEGGEQTWSVERPCQDAGGCDRGRVGLRRTATRKAAGARAYTGRARGASAAERGSDQRSGTRAQTRAAREHSTAPGRWVGTLRRGGGAT